MAEPSAMHERAWRIALLVTGDVHAADAALLAALDKRVPFESIPEQRRHRLILLCVREGDRRSARKRDPLLRRLRRSHRTSRGADGDAVPPTEVAVFTGLAATAMGASRSLREQPREAWMLHRVLNLEIRDVARAMDCSRTAVARHLEEAEKALAAALGREYLQAPEAIRGQLEHAAPGEGVVAALGRQGRKRRAVRVAIGAGAAIMLVVVIATVVILLRRAGAGP